MLDVVIEARSLCFREEVGVRGLFPPPRPFQDRSCVGEWRGELLVGWEACSSGYQVSDLVILLC